MRGDGLRSDCWVGRVLFFVYATQFLRPSTEVIRPVIAPSNRAEHLLIHRIQSHTNPKRRKGFLKQAGQKSSKEELPKQRKGPKRTEECRLKVPTHIWEQDAAGSNPVTRTTFLRKTACLCGFSSFFILFLCLGQLLFSGDFRGRKAARA